MSNVPQSMGVILTCSYECLDIIAFSWKVAFLQMLLFPSSLNQHVIYCVLGIILIISFHLTSISCTSVLMTNYLRHHQDNLALLRSNSKFLMSSRRHQNDVIRRALGDVIVKATASSHDEHLTSE